MMRPNVEHLDPFVYLAMLCRDVRAGLTSTPRTLPSKYSYDAFGSELFDEITRLPDYYSTRAETAILAQHADAIAEISGARTLVELGSSTSAKTRLLLTALTTDRPFERFVPVSVDPVVLVAAAATIRWGYPSVEVQPVIGDLEGQLDLLPAYPPRMIVVLGSTIGHLEPVARTRFLGRVRAAMRPGDTFLVSIDMVKDPSRLLRAYDDAAGVTAAFNRNVLTVVNRELDADFDEASFDHVVLWNAEREWVEMHLLSLRDQVVTVGALRLRVGLEGGDLIRTEISARFRTADIEEELALAGFNIVQTWIDPDGDFALSLARPRP
jgi:L-histidine N-alpha-methyltransferase